MSRILLIEDEAAVRGLIERVLTRHGYEVISAADGLQGYARFEQERFDLLVTDILMPNCDGLEAILRIRREQPELPILAISGGGSHAWADVLETAETFGATRTLSKPFAIDDLIGSVRELLGGAADRRTA